MWQFNWTRKIQRIKEITGYNKYLRKGDFSGFFRFVNYNLYAAFCCSTKGNKDYEVPTPKLDTTNLKVAVYTCIAGHYDNLEEPLVVEPGVDYFAFIDIDCPKDSAWKKIDITQFEEYSQLSAAEINRKIRMLPFHYLPGYDYTIYVDGNVEIQKALLPELEKMGECPFGIHYHRNRDCIYDEAVRVTYLRKADAKVVKIQLEGYKKKGFPRHYGLYENSVIIINHHDEGIRQLMEVWWEEYHKFPTRDQLSLAYVIWKMHYDKSKIHIISRNIDKGALFRRVSYHEGKN